MAQTCEGFLRLFFYGVVEYFLGLSCMCKSTTGEGPCVGIFSIVYYARLDLRPLKLD